jgi:Domain of unknown function (DUF1330)
MPKGYWIVRVDVKDEEPVKRYVAGNHPIFEKFGGRFSSAIVHPFARCVGLAASSIFAGLAGRC